MEPFTLILAAVLAQTSTASPPPPAPVPATTRADADGDGAISRAEYMARFDRMDADHDGKLTREERRASMSRAGARPGDMTGHGPRGRQGRPPMEDATRADFLARAGEQFDRLDTNRDGKVDATEWHAGRGPRGDGPPPPSAPAR
ncbi:hypothetical protein [Sphingomonas sp. 1P08PE]|uniref:hypothetical protein n=1 Tax=Sphingomonas sp. 1P08PE TaxID=554122 RepID=UPI0039A15F18